MRAPKWIKVARNQYRLATNGIRWLKPYLPFLIVALLALYIFYAAPAMVDLVFDDAMMFLLSQGAVVSIEIVLFIAFVWFLFFPISLSLREMQASHLEILLSAPVKPSDLMLGEFLGVMPFYSIIIVLLTGFFTALLQPIGTSVLQNILVVLVFILTLLSALWIGTVIGGLLRAQLGGSERGRDIGKAIGFLIALPVVGIMYAVMGAFEETITNPGANVPISKILDIFPSSWGTSLVVEFARNPGTMEPLWRETVTGLGGLFIFFTGSMLIGFMVAERAYNLETGGFSMATAGQDGILYGTVGSITGGGSFSKVVVSFMKDYGRRMQNISRIGYVAGLLLLINIFLVRPEEAFQSLVMAQALFGLLAVFVVGEVTIRGKPTLFIYKMAPRGISRLIKARLIHGWLVTVSLSIALVAIQLSFIPGINPPSFLGFMGFTGGIAAALVVVSLGCFLLLPAFSDKSGQFFMVTLGVTMLSVMSFIMFVVAFSEYWAMLLQLGSLWSLGGILLMLGIIRLRRIE